MRRSPPSRHHWGDYYKARTQAVLDGSWKSGKVWGGVKEGMIRVGDFGPKVPKAVQAEVQARQKDIAAGKLRPVRRADQRQRGQARGCPGPAMTDEQILGMNFLVSGVQGKSRKIGRCRASTPERHAVKPELGHAGMTEAHASLSRRHPEIRRRPFRRIRSRTACWSSGRMRRAAGGARGRPVCRPGAQLSRRRGRTPARQPSSPRASSTCTSIFRRST